jgi:hypothetical protein
MSTSAQDFNAQIKECRHQVSRTGPPLRPYVGQPTGLHEMEESIHGYD